jgi:hypothetical protein
MKSTPHLHAWRNPLAITSRSTLTRTSELVWGLMNSKAEPPSLYYVASFELSILTAPICWNSRDRRYAKVWPRCPGGLALALFWDGIIAYSENQFNKLYLISLRRKVVKSIISVRELLVQSIFQLMLPTLHSLNASISMKLY